MVSQSTPFGSKFTLVTMIQIFAWLSNGYAQKLGASPVTHANP